MEIKEEKKFNTGIKYKNSKWRPNVFISSEYRENIETWLNEHGYKSINEYLIACLKKDGII